MALIEGKAKIIVPEKPKLATRLGKAARYLVSGIDPGQPGGWFTPGQPLYPVKDDLRGRRMDFPTGVNIRIDQRDDTVVSFQELRLLAEHYDLARLLIETRKDQMEGLGWTVRPKSDPDEIEQPTDDQNRRADAVMELLQYPDGENSFGLWMRQLLEDLLVLDAPVIYVNTEPLDGPWFEVLDGATVKRIVDGRGRTPRPPDPAYQQILKGVPAVDYTSDEIIYAWRNPRPHLIYGMSPIQQIVITVNIGLRRQWSQLQFYTDGTVPDALIEVPESWTPDQISEFQKNWDSLHEDNFAMRRHARFVPGGVHYQATKDAVLKNEFDEWLARITAFAFSIPPTAFVKQTNRATAETVKEAALEEGLAPLMRWFHGVMNTIVQKHLDQKDLEFAWLDQLEVDKEVQAKIDEAYVHMGAATINEIRDSRGDDPIEGGDTAMVYTSSGPVPVAQLAQAAASLPETAPAPSSAPGRAPKQEEGGQVGVGEEEVGKGRRIPFADGDVSRGLDRFVVKATRRLPPLSRASAAYKRSERLLAKVVGRALKRSASKAASGVTTALKRFQKALSKEELDEIVASIIAATEFIPLEALADSDQSYAAYSDAFADASLQALGVVGAADRAALVDQINTRAEEFAEERAAELVGKRIVDGKVVDNPNAVWRIDETTRALLRGTVLKGLQEGLAAVGLAKEIEDSYAFSETRANAIARTEISFAHNAGAFEGYRQASDIGVKVKKAWLTAGDDLVDEEICRPNEDQGPIDLDDVFDSGDAFPPGHPNCRCSLISVVEDEGVEQVLKYSEDQPRDDHGRFTSGA